MQIDASEYFLLVWMHFVGYKVAVLIFMMYFMNLMIRVQVYPICNILIAIYFALSWCVNMSRIDQLINSHLKALKKQVNTIYGLENIQTNII